MEVSQTSSSSSSLSASELLVVGREKATNCLFICTLQPTRRLIPFKAIQMMPDVVSSFWFLAVRPFINWSVWMFLQRRSNSSSSSSSARQLSSRCAPNNKLSSCLLRQTNFYVRRMLQFLIRVSSLVELTGLHVQNLNLFDLIEHLVASYK